MKRCTSAARFVIGDLRPEGPRAGFGSLHPPLRWPIAQEGADIASTVALLDPQMPTRMPGWSTRRRAAPPSSGVPACDLALAADVDAIVTAPLNKAAMDLGTYLPWAPSCWPSELVLAGQQLLVGLQLQVVHVSTTPAAEAIRRLTLSDGADHRAGMESQGAWRPIDRGRRPDPHASEGGCLATRSSPRLCPLSRRLRAAGM